VCLCVFVAMCVSVCVCLCMCPALAQASLKRVAVKAFEQHSCGFIATEPVLAPMTSYNRGAGFGRLTAVCATGDRRVIVVDSQTGHLCFFTALLAPLRPVTALVLHACVYSR
jgi:hypothetical protein